MSKSPASWSGRATLAELKTLGIDPNVSGMASAALRLAAALDEGSAPTSISALTREYRPIMTMLRKGGRAGSADDSLDALLGRRNVRRAQVTRYERRAASRSPTSQVPPSLVTRRTAEGV